VYLPRYIYFLLLKLDEYFGRIISERNGVCSYNEIIKQEAFSIVSCVKSLHPKTL